MTTRQRGATWLLTLILLGRLVDSLNLPFERRTDEHDLQAVHAADTLEASPGDATPPSVRRPSSAAAPIPDTLPTNGPVAINQAGVQELQTLPRVGPVLAARIVAWRDTNGPFHSMSDLQRVPGIGVRTAAQLAPLVRFD